MAEPRVAANVGKLIGGATRRTPIDPDVVGMALDGERPACWDLAWYLALDGTRWLG